MFLLVSDNSEWKETIPKEIRIGKGRNIDKRSIRNTKWPNDLVAIQCTTDLRAAEFKAHYKCQKDYMKDCPAKSNRVALISGDMTAIDDGKTLTAWVAGIYWEIDQRELRSMQTNMTKTQLMEMDQRQVTEVMQMLEQINWKLMVVLNEKQDKDE